MHSRCICVWEYLDAPPEFQALSQHGGDEDWIVYCPSEQMGMPSVFWDVLNSESTYVRGWGHTDYHQLDNGAVVVVLAHA
jgi:hypothetical protein